MLCSTSELLLGTKGRIIVKYIYETERRNYEDFSSGRVLYNQSGTTSFPVRLASEIFLRSKKYLMNKNVKSPFSIYDPCCGGAYLLTTLGFLHGNDLSEIIASDIDENAVDLAKRNLALLTLPGMNKRMDELQNYIKEFDKDSHKEAFVSASRLKTMHQKLNSPIHVNCFRSDALNSSITMSVDLVITDVPYGNIVNWSNNKNDSLEIFLESIFKVLKSTSILVIITTKSQVVNHDKFNRIKHFTIGKRRVSFLEPIKQ